MNPITLSLVALGLALAAGAAASWSWWNMRSLNRLRRTFFAGSQGKDLEQIIHLLAQNQQQLETQQAQLEQGLAKIKSDFNTAVQKVGVVRFNPFADGGGNFSFSIALLDGYNSGVIITSMHGREQNRIYTKKIQDGQSESVLTEEETQAIKSAVNVHQSNIS